MLKYARENVAVPVRALVREGAIQHVRQYVTSTALAIAAPPVRQFVTMNA